MKSRTVALSLLTLGAIACSSAPSNGVVDAELLGTTREATIVPSGPYGIPVDQPVFDFGLTQWNPGVRQLATLQFYAPEDQDITASFASPYQGIWNIDKITRQEDFQGGASSSVPGGGPIHVFAGDVVDVDFSMNPWDVGKMDTELWVRGDKWIAKAAVKSTITVVGKNPAITAYITMHQEPPFIVGSVVDGNPSTLDHTTYHSQVEFDLHVLNVGASPDTFDIVQVASPAGVSMSPVTGTTLAPGQSTVISKAAQIDFSPRTPASDATFTVRVHPYGATERDSDFSFPLQVYLDGCVAGQPPYANSTGCCPGYQVIGGTCSRPAPPPPCTGLGGAVPAGGSCCSPYELKNGYCEQPHCGEDSPTIDNQCCVHSSPCEAKHTPYTSRDNNACYCGRTNPNNPSVSCTGNPGQIYCACYSGPNIAEFSCAQGLECEGVMCLPKPKNLPPPLPKPGPPHTMQ